MKTKWQHRIWDNIENRWNNGCNGLLSIRAIKISDNYGYSDERASIMEIPKEVSEN